jgi:hypothetical protein
MTLPRRPEILGRLVILALALCACSVKAPVYGLRPEYPQSRVRRGGKEPVFSMVDSRRPELRWEAFPPRDQAGVAVADATLSRAKWIVYDVKLWREENGAPGALVEEHSGLPEPRYQFQNPLENCAKYFWTVRARFTLDGREQATEWGVIQTADRPRWVNVVPDPDYYRFQTPCGH